MPLPEAKWNVKVYGAFDKNQVEAQQNAVMAWALLGNLGWTLNAVCGYWGNVEAESGFNPWRWQSDVVLSSDSPLIGYPGSGSTGHAYGLCQWDPAGKYIKAPENLYHEYAGFGPNFSDQQGSLYDGTAQVMFLNDNADYIPTPTFPMSYAEFKSSTADPRDLAKVWLLNFERPYNQSTAAQEYRAGLAYWWWNFLSQGQPIVPGEPIVPPAPPPVPPQPWDVKKSKFVFYLKPYWKRGLY